jgi:hypothetical protein
LRRKLLWIVLAVLLLVNGIVLIRRYRMQPTGYSARLAPDTCSCGWVERVLHLHLSNHGRLTINGEPVPRDRLSRLLSEIYGVRGDKTLYVSADQDVSYQDVIGLIDTVENLPPQRKMPLPPELRAETDRLQIEVTLVTDRSSEVGCKAGCFNWMKKPLIIR